MASSWQSAVQKLDPLRDGLLTKSATFTCQECGHELELKGLYAESVRAIHTEMHKGCRGHMYLTKLVLHKTKSTKKKKKV